MSYRPSKIEMKDLNVLTQNLFEKPNQIKTLDGNNWAMFIKITMYGNRVLYIGIFAKMF